MGSDLNPDRLAGTIETLLHEASELRKKLAKQVRDNRGVTIDRDVGVKIGGFRNAWLVQCDSRLAGYLRREIDAALPTLLDRAAVQMRAAALRRRQELLDDAEALRAKLEGADHADQD